MLFYYIFYIMYYCAIICMPLYVLYMIVTFTEY